jgi:hypothetical protein
MIRINNQSNITEIKGQITTMKETKNLTTKIKEPKSHHNTMNGQKKPNTK